MSTVVDEHCYIHGILLPPLLGSSVVGRWRRRDICRLVSTHPPTSSITEHPSTDHAYQNIRLVVLLELL